jgi:hypothetical protein
MSNQRMHFDLELALDSEPIAGWLAPAGETQVAFSGYTGLIAALERARDSQADEATSEFDSQSAPGRARSEQRNATGGSQR